MPALLLLLVVREVGGIVFAWRYDMGGEAEDVAEDDGVAIVRAVVGRARCLER